MKKLLAALLAVMMLLSVAPLSVFAANGPVDEDIVTPEGNINLAFIRISETDKFDTYFDIYANKKVNNNAIDGATYDKSKNTLTLKNFNHPDKLLSTNMMGDDFKIVVEGSCALGNITVYGDAYGGSLRLSGSGTITVNASQTSEVGIALYAESSDSRLTIDNTVTAVIKGSVCAYGVYGTPQTEKAKVFSFGNGASLNGISTERDKISRLSSVNVVEKNQEASYRTWYKVTSKSDPKGTYAATFYSLLNRDNGKEQWLPKVKVTKFVYVTSIKAYVEDNSFESVEMDEEDFNKSKEYAIITYTGKEPVKINWYDSDAPLDQTWSYSSCYVNVPEAKEGEYYVTNANILKDLKADDIFYTLKRYIKDGDTMYFVEDSSFEPLSLNAKTFYQMGFAYANTYYEYKDYSSNMLEIIDLETGETSFAYGVANSRTPDAVYGIDSDFENNYTVFQLSRLLYNDAHSRYENDDSFAARTIAREEFLEKGYSYNMEICKEELDAPVIEVRQMDLYVDKNGTTYAKEWDDNVFTYGDNNFTVNNQVITIVEKTDKVKASELTPVYYTEDTGLYNYSEAAKSVTFKPAAVTPAVINPTSVKLSKTAVTLDVGKSIALKAAVAPANATNKTVTWTSSAPKVATVDKNGKIVAKAAGKTTVTVKTANGKKATCTVTVTQPATKITLSKTKLTLDVGKKAALKATIAPKNTTNKAVKWATSNKKVVTVDAKGNIAAKAAGKATVTATTANGKKATCTVTVNAVPTKVTLNKKAVTLKKGKTVALKATVAPKNAKTTCKWTTSNKKVATVDQNGKVKAVKKGKAVITVQTANGKMAKCTVTVK